MLDWWALYARTLVPTRARKARDLFDTDTNHIAATRIDFPVVAMKNAA